jgi:hypothetical protein
MKQTKPKPILCPICGVKLIKHNKRLVCVNCMLLAECYKVGLPEPIREYQFVKDRKWRFDYCWINWEIKLAVELEGGAMTNGRHTRGKGFLDDMVKYDRALEEGWIVLRYPTFPITIRKRKIGKGSVKETIYCIDYKQIRQVYWGMK